MVQRIVRDYSDILVCVTINSSWRLHDGVCNIDSGILVMVLVDSA